MRWKGRRQSTNVEDRRSAAPKVAAGGGVGILVIVVIVWLLGGNPQQVLQSLPQTNAPAPSSSSGGGAEIDPAEAELAEIISVVLADPEEVWNALFQQAGARYREPTLVLFRDQVRSACGFASAASGPFYCPGDEQVYIDLSFYEELSRRFGAPGDFAQAYIVAHEIGHHVQKLLGTTEQVHARKGRVPEAEYNELSVRLELQADFLAGVWAHHAQQAWGILEPGDIEEAMRAARAIGDDTIQKRSRGHVVPESFTHGTSAQRMRWFMRGLETGDRSQGDTFGIPARDL
jgi:predicted metalloprotease